MRLIERTSMDPSPQASQRKYVYACICGCVISGVWLLILFPGTLSNDSILSWWGAANGVFDTIKPPLTEFVQYVLLRAFGNARNAIVFYSFVQGALFWSGLFLCIASFTRTMRAAVAGWIVLAFWFPLWTYTNVHWTDVSVAEFAMFAFFFFTRAWFTEDRVRCTRLVVWATACMLVSMCARFNAVSLCPVLFIAWWVLLRRRWLWPTLRAHAAACAVTVLVLVITQVPMHLPGVMLKPSLANFGLLNQYLGTIANSTPSVANKLITEDEPAYDAAFGGGALRNSILSYLPSFNGLLLWGVHPTLGFDNILAHGKTIRQLFLKAARESPLGFLRHKKLYLQGQFWRSAEYYPFHETIDRNRLGVMFSPISPEFAGSLFAALHRTTKGMFYKHGLIIGLGLLAGVIAWSRQRMRIYSMFSLSAGLYAIPYCLFETGWEWRYLMPSYVFSLLAVIALIANWKPNITESTPHAAGY